MAVKMKEFLEQFFKQRHFDKMPPAVRARFNDYLKNNDLVGEMKNWRKELMTADGKNKPLPDATQMDDADWVKLYRALHKAFQNMHHNAEDFKDNKKATDFMNQYFGSGMLFEPATATTEAKVECEKLADLLEDKNNKELITAFNKQLLDIDNDKWPDAASFAEGLRNGDYNNDTDFVKTLKRVLGNISWEKPQLLNGIDIDEITYGFNNTNISRFKIDDLKNDFTDILNKIHDESKIADVFKNYDSGKISGPLAEARKKVAYDDKDKKEFVPEKLPDKKGLLQRIGDAATKFEENNLDSWGRILTLRGTRRFFSQPAKDVVTALQHVKTKDGKKLKPTDGLKGILENKDAILGKLVNTSKNGYEHFKWFATQLETFSKETPRDFAGALRNPGQMLSLVSNIIYRAVQDNKIDEAKTAMEIISVMKYSVFTSRTVDALGKEDLSVLSDKDLSWNKYEGVRFVTKALDKTAKYALLGLGRGCAALHNIYMLRHNKFKGNFSGIEAAQQKDKENNSNTLDNVKKNLERRNTDKQNVDNAIDALGGKDFLQSELKKYDTLVQNRDQMDQNIRQKEEELAMMRSQPQEESVGIKYDQYGHEIRPEQNLENEIMSLKSGLRKNEAELGKYDTDQLDEYRRFLNESDDIEKSINGLKAKQKSLEDAQTKMNENQQDKQMELMAYWDMLESHWKSHKFTFAGKWMQKRFLDPSKNRNNPGTSRADTMTQNFLKKYMQKYGNQVNQ